MKKRRLELIRAKMQKEDLQLLVVASASNRRWLSGFTGSAGMVVVSPTQAWLLVDFRYITQAGHEADGCQLVQVDDFYKQLGVICAEQGATRVGFESAHVTHAIWEKLQQAVASTTWVPVKNWVEEERGCKDESELASLAKAAAIADAAFTSLLPALKPGMAEKDIALELEFLMRKAGAESMAFPPIVAAGVRGAMPHATPGENKLAVGDFITMDFGAVWQGYCSDITRTVALGRVDEKQRSVYNLVLAAQQAALAAVAPGKKGCEVDAVARDMIAAAGYDEAFGHGLGHGVGLDVHEEFPRLSRIWEGILQPGMVCSVEPGIYLAGWGGVRIEDLVVVTANGCRILNQAPKELLVLPV